MNVWGKNITDKFYRASIYANGTSRQLLSALGAPRTYGVTLGYTF